ncbi:lytic murein transglycosylase [Patescibacteria group bacterium]
MTKLTIWLVLIGLTAVFFGVAQAESEIDKKKREIRVLEAKIEKNKDEIEARQDQEFSYANHIKILEGRTTQNQTEQDYLQERVDLTKLEINTTEASIDDSENSLIHQQTILGSYLRDLNRYDRTNKMLLFLNSSNLSDFYNQVNYTENISEKSYSLVTEIEENKLNLETDREVLVNKRLEQESLLSDLKIYEAELARVESELNIMRQRNAEEIVTLADTVNHSTEVHEQLKQELFAMTREGQSIKFQEAVKYSKFASDATGVRQELIMSIVKQETDFGNNVGNGYYKSDMNPNQWETFIQVCKELGRSPETTKVSAQPSYGWGGAMGIAQFLPKTWLTVNQEVSQITGNSPADPWDPLDAFVAVGVKLKGMGAVGGNRDKEWEAAGRYFAGGNYQKYPWYADNVLDRAEKYKDMLGQLDTAKQVANEQTEKEISN